MEGHRSDEWFFSALVVQPWANHIVPVRGTGDQADSPMEDGGTAQGHIDATWSGDGGDTDQTGDWSPAAVNRFAVILTHNRPDMLRDCIFSIWPQVDVLIIVDNASDPPVDKEALPFADDLLVVLRVEEQPPNLSRLWNMGIYEATMMSLEDCPEFYIAMLCDDTIVPEGWFDVVTTAMAEFGAAAGCSHPGDTTPGYRLLKTLPDGDLANRMPGWAFILDGNKELRADERLHWWWCDTDLDWRARAAGGMVMVSGYPVPNRLPNDFTVNVPGLAQQAGADGEMFVQIHGNRPW